MKIRKAHYVFICIIHEHETLNVNKVNSKETPVALNPYGRSKRDKTGATEKHTSFEGTKTKNELVGVGVAGSPSEGGCMGEWGTG